MVAARPGHTLQEAQLYERIEFGIHILNEALSPGRPQGPARRDFGFASARTKRDCQTNTAVPVTTPILCKRP
jgi:hypothetical protein